MFQRIETICLWSGISEIADILQERRNLWLVSSYFKCFPLQVRLYIVAQRARDALLFLLRETDALSMDDFLIDLTVIFTA